MMISNWNKPFDLQGFLKKFSALRVNGVTILLQYYSFWDYSESPLHIYPLQRWNMFVCTTETNVFSIWNHDKCLSQLFPLHLNVPVQWVYRHYKYFTFSVRWLRLDVRIWRLKTVPALKGLSPQLKPCTTDTEVLYFMYQKTVRDCALNAWGKKIISYWIELSIYLRHKLTRANIPRSRYATHEIVLDRIN